ncbi:uncharacterized protein LOC134064045 isoform X1 [Sardina pilchardus]|uniref:uncharacterized protein LOC134064045 isoform X1 n=1 Tax=Sardina pilchardus TaxID=27697 RepID=UPI002E0D6B42
MDDVTEKESSPISRQTIVGVVNTISTELDVENGQCSSSPSQDLTSLDERLERLLSNERLTAFAHNLAEQVHYLFLLDQKRKAVNKSASDSALLNMGQSGSLSKMDNIREAIQIYAEETVKNFFLPCFNIPAPWNIDVGRFLPQASSSVSCPSFLYSMYEIIPQGACRSPPQVLQSTIQTLTAVTVRDIMNSLPQEEQAVQEPLPDSERVFSRPSSGVSEVCSVSPDIVTDYTDPLLSPMESSSDDYTSPVTVLILRLLSKLNNQQSLSDDMLDTSRVLIDRVISEIETASGLTNGTACPEGVKIRKISRVIYTELVHEFGGKEALLRTMMSEGHSFEKALVRILSRELIQTSVQLTPEEKKTKRQRFRFLPKMSKVKAFFNIKLKRSKSGNCAGEQSTNLDLDLNPTSSAHGDTAVQCGGCFPCVKTASSTSDNRATTSESSMKKPRKGVFSRMISLISKKSSKICPEALG